MDHQRWLAALVAARKAGGISDRTLGVAVMLGSVVNWSRPEPGIYWSTAAFLQETGLQRDAFYRARKELIEAGLMEDIKGTLCCTYATDRRASATDRRNSATHMDGVYDAGSAQLTAENHPALSATTSISEITSRYPHHETDDQHFAHLLASILTVGILQHWPETPAIDTSVLVRLFESAVRQYPRAVLVDVVRDWLDENGGDPSLRKPVAVFYRRAWSLFATHHEEAQAL